MSVTKEEKKKIISKFGGRDWNTWSTEVQIAIITSKIENLKNHLLEHKKDNHSRRWIMLMVAKRRKLLSYLKKKNSTKYTEILKKLKLRK